MRSSQESGIMPIRLPERERAPRAVISKVFSTPVNPMPGIAIFGSTATTMPSSSGSSKPAANTGRSSTVSPVPCPRKATLLPPIPIKPSACPALSIISSTSRHSCEGASPGRRRSAQCRYASSHAAWAAIRRWGRLAASPDQYTCVLSVLYPSTVKPTSTVSNVCGRQTVPASPR